MPFSVKMSTLMEDGCGSQGYNGQYEGYMNGHEAAIDQAEMAARGMSMGQHSRGELSAWCQ